MVPARLLLVIIIALPAVVFAQTPNVSPMPGREHSASAKMIDHQSTAHSNGRIDFHVLDVATGYAIRSATIKWGLVTPSRTPELSHSGSFTSGGHFVHELSPGEYVFEISAPGYKSMRSHIGVVQDAVAPADINLDPISPPEELREDAVNSELRSGLELVQGYISDSVTHRPIAGVEIRLKQSGATAVTNAEGYFQLYADAISTADASSAEEFPELDTLTATAPGYKVHTLSGLLHVPESSKVIRIALIRGTGVSHADDTPRPLRPPGSVPDVPPPTKHPLSKELQSWLSALPGKR